MQGEWKMSEMTVGRLLQTVRIEKNITVKEASAFLRIKESYVKDMEADKWSKLEGKIYLTGCIRAYANWLSLDSEELLGRYKFGQGKTAFDSVSYQGAFRILPSEQIFLPNAKFWLMFLIPVLVAALLLYRALSYEVEVEPLYHRMIEEALIKDAMSLYENKKLLFIPTQDTYLVITKDHSQERETKHLLRQGEVFTITYNREMNFYAEYPNRIDIYLQDESQKHLGTMDVVFRPKLNWEN